MSKIVNHWAVIPMNSYDMPALEAWLARMAAKGWQYHFAVGPLCQFRQREPIACQVHLEPVRGKNQEDPELTALYNDAGWDYWGIFRGNYHVFATENLEAQAHTDAELLDYTLKGFTRRKLLAGLGLLAANFVLLSLYLPSSFNLSMLTYLPIQMSIQYRLPHMVLTLLGLGLMNLAYFAGLFHLFRHRKMVKAGGNPAPKKAPWDGYLLAAGVVLLLPVLLHLGAEFYHLSYQPIELKDSNFITLTELDGVAPPPEDDPFRASVFFPDRVSHSDNLMEPESWYLRQEAEPFDDPASPGLEIHIYRFHFTQTASRLAEEWWKKFYYVSWVSVQHAPDTDYELLPPSHGFDQVLVHPGLNGQSMILRRDSTVLHVNYRGSQDLTHYLDRFAQMVDEL